MATFTKQIAQGTPTTLLSTELTGLANGAGAVSTVVGTSGVVNNVPGTANFDGYTNGLVTLNLGAPAAPITGPTPVVSLWFMRSIDGTTFESLNSAGFPIRPPDYVFSLQGGQGVQICSAYLPIPVGYFKTCISPSGLGTGVALNATNTLKILPSTTQQV